MSDSVSHCEDDDDDDDDDDAAVKPERVGGGSTSLFKLLCVRNNGRLCSIAEAVGQVLAATSSRPRNTT